MLLEGLTAIGLLASASKTKQPKCINLRRGLRVERPLIQVREYFKKIIFCNFYRGSNVVSLNIS
jgi:hypothetical protein